MTILDEAHFFPDDGKDGVDTGCRVEGSIAVVEGKPVDGDVFEVVADGDADTLSDMIAFSGAARLAALRSKRPEEYGRNLLHCAVVNGRLGVLNLLLSHKDFDPNQVDSVYTRSTPLMEAVKSSRLDLVTALFNAGARLDTQDVNGDTCLHWAAREVSAAFLRQVLQLARKNGYSCRKLTSTLKLTNANGNTAADVAATDLARDSIARLLSGEEEPGALKTKRQLKMVSVSGSPPERGLGGQGGSRCGTVACAESLPLVNDEPSASVEGGPNGALNVNKGVARNTISGGQAGQRRENNSRRAFSIPSMSFSRRRTLL